MASNFKNVSAKLTAVSTVLFTTPADKTIIVIGMIASHTAADESPVKISATKKAVNNSVINIIGKDTVIPKGSALSFLDGKLVVQAGESISMSADTVDACEVCISYMEI